jgi:hypothetical protein
VHVQALVPKRTVERLHVAIVGRLARPAEIDPRFAVICPQV